MAVTMPKFTIYSHYEIRYNMKSIGIKTSVYTQTLQS